MSLFADDIKMNIGIKNIEDAETLQSNLDILYQWQDVNNMQLNDTKFQLLQFDKEKVKYNYWYMTLNCNNPIYPIDQVEDLGVVIDSN